MILTRCCTPTQSAFWLQEIAALALAGDQDARRLLPNAVEHYLAVSR